jgi:hypothetical protein
MLLVRSSEKSTRRSGPLQTLLRWRNVAEADRSVPVKPVVSKEGITSMLFQPRLHMCTCTQDERHILALSILMLRSHTLSNDACSVDQIDRHAKVGLQIDNTDFPDSSSYGNC